MVLDESFFQEEERCGFLVTEKRKKVWAVGLELLERFGEVCKKHGLTYFVYYGTLLGAVRHQGFIPWDDDIDVVMFRDDYERLQEIAPQEFIEPYFFQNAYTDCRVWPFSKIRDSRTTAIEHNLSYLRDFHHGIFIDICPLDSVSDGINQDFSMIEEIRKLLWCIVTDENQVLQKLSEGGQFLLEPDFILDLLHMDVRMRFKVFEDFNTAHFGETSQVNYIIEEMMGTPYQSVNIDCFCETIYVPFENIQVPVPAGYDKILTRSYGDYRQLIRGGSAHEGMILEPESPYKEYFEKYL